MIRPSALESEAPVGPWSCRGIDIWDTFCAAERGDTAAVQKLLERDPNLYRCEYFYTQPIHFAVREGYASTVQLLLDWGADPRLVGLDGESLLIKAQDRGHHEVASLLARACKQAEANARDHPIFTACGCNDTVALEPQLANEPDLVHSRDRFGATPLHRAVTHSAKSAVKCLIDYGADVNALHCSGPASRAGYPPVKFQPIDSALWYNSFWNVKADFGTAHLLIQNGAEYDLVVAAALGDVDFVRSLLSADPGSVKACRPSEKRALSTAIEFGNYQIARILLAQGADPNWPDGATAPNGAGLHAASRGGNREMVELLLEHGADPNSYIDSSGTATYAAKTDEIRALLRARGGLLDPYDLLWLNEDEEALRLITADPGSADRGCGGVLAAACTLAKREVLERLLSLGVRVPKVLTECRSYLFEDPELLKLLLDSGMDPDLPNWQRATPLHDLCGRDGRGRPHSRRRESAIVLLEAGADISARDENYCSTPLGWAARNGLSDMVELLLSQRAQVNLPGVPDWATPLAWATRREHHQIVQLLESALGSEA